MTSLFLSIVNRSIAVGITILAVIAVRALTRRSPKWTRGILWAIVALQLILPFTLHSAVSIVPELPQFSQGEEAYNPIEPEISKPAPSVGKLPELSTALPEHTDSVTAKPTEPQVIPQDTVQTTPQNVSAAQSGVTAADIFAIIWLVGAAAMLMYLAVGYIRLWVRIRGSVREADGVWHNDTITTAFVFGVLRPRIYLPGKTEPGARECMIAHERAHIRRGDHITKLLAFLLLSVYWFNPLVWIAYILFCRDIELACDERAIRGTEPAHMQEYARALLSESGVKKTVAAYPLSFGGHTLKTRIKNILNYKKPPFWVIVATLLVSALTAACFATAPIEKEANAPVSAPSDTETEPSETETEPSESETAPSDTETEPSESETAPSDTETAPSESETAPSESETAPSEIVPEPTEPETDPVPTEWVWHPAGSTRYTVEPRTALPQSATQVQYTDSSLKHNKYSYPEHRFEMIAVPIDGGEELDDARSVAICVADTYEELLSIEDYLVGDSGEYALAEYYTESYFEDRSIIFMCNYSSSGGISVYPVSLYCSGSELCISAETYVKRANLGVGYMCMVSFHYNVMEVDKSALDGIDTIGCYITASNPAFPFEIRTGYGSGFADGTLVACTLGYHMKNEVRGLGEYLFTNDIRGLAEEYSYPTAEFPASAHIEASIVSDADSFAESIGINQNGSNQAAYDRLVAKYNSAYFENHMLILVGWYEDKAREWQFKGLSRSGDELCAQFTIDNYEDFYHEKKPYGLTVIEVEKKALDGIGGFSFYVEKK